MKEVQIVEGRILADLSFSEVESEWIVIFCHGYKGYKDWGAWNLVADEFTKQGVDFLKFNFSLNGGTIEDPIDFPDLDAFGRNTYTQELDDLNTVITYANERFPDKRITVIGHSRGGGIATLAAAQNSKVNKLVTWASVADFERRFPQGDDLDAWKENGVRYILNGRTKQKMPHDYTFYEDYFENEESLNILNWVEQIEVPHLVIHGTLDEAVDIKEAKELCQANPAAELFSLKASHTFGSKHPWEGSELPFDLQQIVNRTINFVK